MPVVKRHAWSIGLLSVLFLVINLILFSRQPYVWIDEAYFADPAINFTQGKGFTSSVWSNSPADQTFVSTAPIYSLALSVWLRAFGAGMLSVRSFDYFLTAAALSLIAVSALRLGLFRETRQIVLLYALVALGYGTSFAFRSARPEPLALLFAAAAFFSFTWRSRSARAVFLFLIGLVIPGLGPHLIVYFGLFFSVLAAFIWRRVWLEGLVFIAGMLLGFAALKFIYGSLGVWPAFVTVIESKGGMNILSRVRERLFSNPLSDHSGIIPKDFSLFVLLLLVPISLWHAVKRQTSFRWNSLEVFNVIFVATIICGMFLVAKFSTYYSWMVFVPLSLTCCAAWPRLDSPDVVRWCRNLLLIIACLVGLPMQMALASADWKERDPTAMEKWVSGLIDPADVVFSDYPCFYPVKSYARKSYFLFHWPQMTPEKKTEVTLLLLGPHKTYQKTDQEIVSQWGGSWTLVDRFIPIRTGPLGHDWRFGYLSLPNYELKAYRRVPTVDTSGFPASFERHANFDAPR